MSVLRRKKFALVSSEQIDGRPHRWYICPVMVVFRSVSPMFPPVPTSPYAAWASVRER
jgi:hypothetical protein